MNHRKIMVVRGHQVTPWELRPWLKLPSRYETAYLSTRRNSFDVGSLELERVPIKTRSDRLPGRAGAALGAALEDRYIGLQDALSSSDIVHTEELYPWFAAQPAALRSGARWKLVVTCWETIPMLSTYRTARARHNRELVLKAADMFLPTTRRARDCLLVEGVPDDRIELVSPGIDLARFAGASPPAAKSDPPLIVSPARLVWEKGHQDLLRAVAALERGLVGHPLAARVLIVGSGPEHQRLEAYASELGIADRVEIRKMVPYDEMPSIYAQASCMVLASLPSAEALAPRRPPAFFWEEQFGYVLVEAMASGLPIVASDSGAIPEVVAGHADHFAAGDWLGLARKLADGPLVRPGGRRDYPRELLDRYSVETAANRLAEVYDRVLAG